MLNKKEISELREHLEKAQNPLFYFDNDQDGLCSYLLLKRNYGKGKGIPVKGSLGKEYLRRVEEFNPDYIFILDQPTVSNEFFEALKKKNIPVVWIDHHGNDIRQIPSLVKYYNPLFSSKTNEPVTKICYEITKRKEDLWIVIVGGIADKFLPEEYGDFLIKYPDLGINSSEPFKIFYESEIGKISRMIGVGLKDRTSLVMKMIRFLIDVRTPYEVLEENSFNFSMHKRFHEVNSKLQKLVSRAKEDSHEKLIFFKYSSDISMSADISNKLSYEFPNKIIVVVREKGFEVNLSLRGKGIKKVFLEAIKEIPFAKGGGHEDAVGGQMNEKDLKLFETNLRRLIEKQKF